MNRVCVVTQVQPARAKHLRRSDSGVFVLHGVESANDDARAPVAGSAAAPTHPVLPFTSHIRTPEKASVRMEVVEILATCASIHGISNADLGATINETAEDVRRIREGQRPLTTDHLLRIARRRGALWADIRVRLEGAK